VATLVSWLGSDDIGEASTTLPFSRTREELRLDCEQLAAHPDTPHGPQGEPRIDIGRLTDAGAAASSWVRK
jgi:hypothetical protein